jgi:hypothetical protein
VYESASEADQHDRTRLEKSTDLVQRIGPLQIYALHANPFSEIAIVSQLEQSWSARTNGSLDRASQHDDISVPRQHESIQRQLFVGESDDMENCISVAISDDQQSTRAVVTF